MNEGVYLILPILSAGAFPGPRKARNSRAFLLSSAVGKKVRNPGKPVCYAGHKVGRNG